MAINDGSTTPLTGFPGTIAGVTQESYEESAGARKIERVKNESNETAAVVVTGRHTDLSIVAHLLATYAATYKVSSVIAYNAINYRVTSVSKVKSPTLTRLNLSMRKEASMTYSV